jgi:F-type H+-transporting ATPase subunit beta
MYLIITLLTVPAAFYMVGDLESARAKGEKILADLENK